MTLTKRMQRQGRIFLAPTFIILALLGLYPLIQTLLMSFTDARMASGEPLHFVGIDNYLNLFSRKPFWESVEMTVVFAVFSVAVETVLGLLIALALCANIPLKGILRAAILIPWALPTVVSARMWNYMLVDTYGVINDILYTRLHLVAEKIAWMSRPDTAFAAIVAIDVWKTTPFVVLLLIAGLQVIPRQAFEAAAVDGAGVLQRFRHITLPLLAPAILVAMVFRMLDALRIFDSIWVLTRGQMGTESMATFTYRQMIDFRKIGLGSAASVAIFLLIGIFVIVYLSAARIAIGQENEN